MLKITIYTTETCSKCRMIKEYLEENFIPYTALDAVEHYDDVKDTWFMSAPIIKVETIVEWEDNPIMWFEDIQEFINYLNKNKDGWEAEYVPA